MHQLFLEVATVTYLIFNTIDLGNLVILHVEINKTSLRINDQIDRAVLIFSGILDKERSMTLGVDNPFLFTCILRMNDIATFKSTIILLK